jgi:hypothetical protein
MLGTLWVWWMDLMKVVSKAFPTVVLKVAKLVVVKVERWAGLMDWQTAELMALQQVAKLVV